MFSEMLMSKGRRMGIAWCRYAGLVTGAFLGHVVVCADKSRRLPIYEPRPQALHVASLRGMASAKPRHIAMEQIAPVQNRQLTVFTRREAS